MTKNPSQPSSQDLDEESKNAQEAIDQENQSTNVPREDTALETESPAGRDR